MRIDIAHRIEYRYEQPVFVEPFTIRLRPGTDDAQRLLGHRCVIEPTPAGLTELTDFEGNLVTQVWFDGTHDRLRIDIASSVETRRSNPYDYLLLSSPTLPARYAVPADRVERFLDRSVHPSVAAFAAQAPDDAQRFAIEMTERLHGFRRIVREHGDPHPAHETLEKREGSCRDLAMLLVHAARSRGIAARFVSGYTQGDPDEPEQHLHAWAELAIPEGGWRGFDPTLGLAVADRHVWVARAPTPAEAAPTTGTYRGTGVGSTLHTSLRVAVS